MKFVVALLLAGCFTVPLFAQESAQLPPTTPPEDQSSTSNPITSLASQFLEHDFLNFFLFANLVYDSEPISLNGRTVNAGGFGFDGGGGVNANKILRDGFISLSYRGDYRDYASSFYPSGTSQSLNFAYEKRLGRRWTFSANVNGGIFLYGGTFFEPEPSDVNNVQTNPFSTESKFLSGGVGISYRATRRLSYVFNGQYYLNRYNLPGSLGSTGVSGTGSVLYRTTARTTVGGTYTHTYFTYQQHVGQVQANMLAATLSHIFSARWQVSLQGGVTRTDSNGTIRVPVVIVEGNNLLPGYEIGAYHRVSSFPSYQGTLTHQIQRRSSLSVSAGQGISAGNGVYLASKNLFLMGYYSYSVQRRSNFSFGGGISHLSSVANNVAYSYTSTSFTASYSYSLLRHLGANARYDFVRYGTLGSLGSATDNRFTIGVYFSSKSVPMTLF